MVLQQRPELRQPAGDSRSVRQPGRRQSGLVDLPERRRPAARGAAAKMIEAIRLTGQVTPRHKVGFYLDYQQVCNGSGVRQTASSAATAVTTGSRSAAWAPGSSGARARGRQRVGQPREDHAGLVDVAVHEQAAVRSRCLAVRQPVRRTDPGGALTNFISGAGTAVRTP